MISAELDTNTIVSALLIPRGIPSQILDAALAGDFACFSSDPIVSEVLRTLGRQRVQRKYQVALVEIERVRRFLESDLVTVSVDVPVQGVATHPEDDLVLATALSAQADYLVTGDRQLLRLGAFRGTIVLTPREILERLVQQAAEPGALRDE